MRMQMGCPGGHVRVSNLGIALGLKRKKRLKQALNKKDLSHE